MEIPFHDDDGDRFGPDGRPRRCWSGVRRAAATSEPGGARTGPPADVHRAVQVGHPGRVRRGGGRREGCPSAPRGPVQQPHRGVAAGPRRRRVGRPVGAPGPQASRPAGRTDRPTRGGKATTGAGTGQGPFRGGRPSKTARALGDDLREHGARRRVEQVTDAAIIQLAPIIGVREACERVGAAQAGYYRRHRQSPTPQRPEPIPHRDRHQPRALGEEERQEILDQLHSPRFVDSGPAEVWATLLDEGVYLGSISTSYRVLREAGETGERRRQATHPATVKPELVATQPNQVWSWDITKLRGPAKWTYYYLYVILDIFSRYVVGWMVASRESAALAEVLIRQTCAKQGIGRDQLTIHADRGSSMTSKPVAFLLADLGVTQSHSRPHVSDDNPYSEAQFKTLKYRPDFPGRFGSIEAARLFCRAFFAWYNDEHHHSGLGLHTPADVHYGTAEQTRRKRAGVLDSAYAAHPERFVRTPPR